MAGLGSGLVCWLAFRRLLRCERGVGVGVGIPFGSASVASAAAGAAAAAAGGAVACCGSVAALSALSLASPVAAWVGARVRVRVDT